VTKAPDAVSLAGSMPQVLFIGKLYGFNRLAPDGSDASECSLTHLEISRPGFGMTRI